MDSFACHSKRCNIAFQVWTAFFTLAISFVTQPCLQVEHFSEAKRDRLLEKYGDMRVQMGYEVLAMWQNLGNEMNATCLFWSLQDMSDIDQIFL